MSAQVAGVTSRHHQHVSGSPYREGTCPGASCDVIIINTFPVRLTEGGQALVPRAFCRGTVDFICDTTSVGSTSCNLSLVARFILYIH